MTDTLETLLAEKEKIEKIVKHDENQLRNIKQRIDKLKSDEDAKDMNEFKEHLKGGFIPTQYIMQYKHYIIKLKLSTPFINQYKYLRDDAQYLDNYGYYGERVGNILTLQDNHFDNCFGGRLHYWFYKVVSLENGEVVQSGESDTFELASVKAKEIIDKIEKPDCELKEEKVEITVKSPDNSFTLMKKWLYKKEEK